MTQTFNISGHSNVQVGDHNVQQVHVSAFHDLLLKIETADATPAQKADAKNRLRDFLLHPVTVAVAGGLAGALGTALTPQMK